MRISGGNNDQSRYGRVSSVGGAELGFITGTPIFVFSLGPSTIFGSLTASASHWRWARFLNSGIFYRVKLLP